MLKPLCTIAAGTLLAASLSATPPPNSGTNTAGSGAPMTGQRGQAGASSASATSATSQETTAGKVKSVKHRTTRPHAGG